MSDLTNLKFAFDGELVGLLGLDATIDAFRDFLNEQIAGGFTLPAAGEELRFEVTKAPQGEPGESW